MKIIEHALNGVALLEPRIFADDRGYFLESYNREKLAALGITENFVQDNISRSRKHTMRGMHYQLNPDCQGKLVAVSAGKIFDAVVTYAKTRPLTAAGRGSSSAAKTAGRFTCRKGSRTGSSCFPTLPT